MGLPDFIERGDTNDRVNAEILRKNERFEEAKRLCGQAVMVSLGVDDPRNLPSTHQTGFVETKEGYKVAVKRVVLSTGTYHTVIADTDHGPRDYAQIPGGPDGTRPPIAFEAQQESYETAADELIIVLRQVPDLIAQSG